MGLLKKLMKHVGIVVVILGIFFITVGAYGLAGGTIIKLIINEKLITAQEGGIIFSIVGIIALLGGMAMNYIAFKPSRLVTISTILGLCSLVAPVMLFGMGYYLRMSANYNFAAGILAAVLGYSFLATILIWLRRG